MGILDRDGTGRVTLPQNGPGAHACPGTEPCHHEFSDACAHVEGANDARARGRATEERRRPGTRAGPPTGSSRPWRPSTCRGSSATAPRWAPPPYAPTGPTSPRGRSMRRASDAKPQGTPSRPTATRRGRAPGAATRATPATGTARGRRARSGPAGPRTAGGRCRRGGGSARSAGSSA